MVFFCLYLYLYILMLIDVYLCNHILQSTDLAPGVCVILLTVLKL